MTETIRTRVLDALKTLFEGMDPAQPVGDPYGVQWSYVTRDPIGPLKKGKLNALGVYGLQTERKPRHPLVIVKLSCVIEVHVAKQEGLDMSKAVERLIGVVERRLKEDITLGGLCHDLSISGDQVTVDGPYDNQAEGAVFFDVMYSQQEDDPREGR